jgi:hypothetical protein
MAGGGRSYGARVGVLLLAVHLAAGILLPRLHGADGPDRTPDHAEAAGTGHGGHGDACVVCRFAEARFAEAAPPSVSDAPAPVATPRRGTAEETLPPRPLRAHTPARGPPTHHAAG